MIKLFKEEEFPYDKLERIGLSREMVEDLPTSVLDNLAFGDLSPVLSLRVIDQKKGRKIDFYAKLGFRRMSDGSVDIVGFPVLNRVNLSSYSDKDRESLLIGKPIIISRVGKDGSQVQNVAQIDWQTNHVMEAPLLVISKNLHSLGSDLQLSSSELNVLHKGEPLTIYGDDEEITMGIDLQEPSGVRFARGNMEKWSQQSKKDWDKYNFGIYGCWAVDDDGNFAYVPEEEYTDEIWNEQKKAGLARAASMTR